MYKYVYEKHTHTHIVCVYVYVRECVCNHVNNVSSRLSPQWLCGKSCTWAHDVRL